MYKPGTTLGLLMGILIPCGFVGVLMIVCIILNALKGLL